MTPIALAHVVQGERGRRCGGGGFHQGAVFVTGNGRFLQRKPVRPAALGCLPPATGRMKRSGQSLIRNFQRFTVERHGIWKVFQPQAQILPEKHRQLLRKSGEPREN
jgi:hypothetical protein